MSEGRLDSARVLWALRGSLGPICPELHVRDGDGQFLDAQASGARAPWAAGGLDYRGTFVDALAEGRLSLVLPVLQRNDGALQGMLDFLGLPCAGCGMEGAILADDPDFAKAVLGALGMEWSGAEGGQEFLVGVAGDDDPEAGAAIDPSGACVDDPEIEDFARRVFAGLYLSGWALVGVVREAGGPKWRSIQTSPGLEPDSPFQRSLRARGRNLGSALELALLCAKRRHDAEAGLKVLYKDMI